jgi:hypothetical protein
MLGLGFLGVFALTGVVPNPAEALACPNEAVRQGPSSFLPDCRAYELVTPPDSDGRLFDPMTSTGFLSGFDLFPTELASPTGEGISYETYGTPLSEPAGPIGFFDVYRSERSTDGWRTSRRLTPSGIESTAAYPGGVSTEGAYAFIDVSGTEEHSKGGAGSLALQRMSSYLSKPDGSFELTGKGSLGTEALVQGRYISAGAQHIIFSTGHAEAQSLWCAPAPECTVKSLEPNAPAEGTGAVYDRSAEGPTHVVSLLPGDETPKAGEQAFYQGVSKDGTVVAFGIGGVLYLRVDNAKTEEVAAGEPTYAGLSEDGEFLYYVAAGNIHRFDTVTEADFQVNASGDAEIVNVSGDGSHVYFISKSQLDGSKGVAGEPNLYVWSGGSIEYIATVAPSDLERTSGSVEHYPALTRWTSFAVSPQVNVREDLKGPGGDSSRTTPDGSVLVFESKAKLTSYENAGHTEIYRYDDGSKSFLCVSCNPSGQAATADAELQNLKLVEAPMAIHNLSSDGSRVFFETAEALVERDTDGINDIYEWHEEGDAVELISSGDSTEYLIPEAERLAHFPLPNVIFSIVPSGHDVVFLSQDALVSGAAVGGAPALYDARVDGGFPAEPETPRPCVEEGCRPPVSSPPALMNPLSDTVAGEGNVKPQMHRHKRRHHQRNGKKSHHRAKTKEQSNIGLAAPTQTVDWAASSASPQAADPMPPPQGAAMTQARTLLPTASAAGEFAEFGFEAAGASSSTSGAGMHPDFTTRFALNHFLHEGIAEATARLEDIHISLPPGLVGNLIAFPRCSTGLLIAFNCPTDAQVGISKVLVTGFSKLTEPIYNMEVAHPDREIARLGFIGGLYPVFVDIKVRTAGDYGVTATVEDAPGLAPVLESETTLWGNPPDHSHDEERLSPGEAIPGCETACLAPGGKRESTLPPTALMSNPSACQGGEVGFSATSYQLPGQVFGKSAPLAPITKCSGLPFRPSFEAKPTNHRAGAPTGLETTLKLPQSTNPEIPATATMREVRVTLPEGMGIAAGAADGIAACSEEQVHLHEEVVAQCPDASKLGNATFVSPDLPEPIEGALYQRTPEPGNPFRVWLVSDALGLHIKLPGEIKANPNTGQLTAIFSDLPQVPVEEIQLDVWGGPRAPLANPATCGTYSTAYAVTPHSEDQPISGESQMTIDEGCNAGFSPKLRAGVTNPTAGAFSPFIFDLTREDGEQGLRGFEVTLPEGELAKLAGVPLCPDAQAATGACPAGSKIGAVTAAAGPGPDPLWLPQPGKAPTAIYLSGPYEGAPFSIVTAVPAQAGPFDLGIVAVRSALEVDPETARATVKADPLPRFVEGVPVAYRRLHAVIDRPGFSLNPTDCRELAVTSSVTSLTGTVAHPSDRFQVDGCKALAFKPKLRISLKGSTKHAGHPALKAVLTYPKGGAYANVARAQVNLPHSEFIDQANLNKTCTKPVLLAGKCPKTTIYGRAKLWTPLLEKPLEGPVYLVGGYGYKLPALVAELDGQIRVLAVSKVDSGPNHGIRSTFEAVPDAPIEKFVLEMKGGPKYSLLENSEPLCKRPQRAIARFTAQNGKVLQTKPLISNECGKKKAKKGKKKTKK